MNLFALDLDPVKAARAHCDRHVGKMAVEALWLMAGAHEMVDFIGGLAPYDKPHRLPPRFRDRKCARWVRETRANYEWTWVLCQELFDEHRRRSGSMHEEQDWLLDYWEPPEGLQEMTLTPFGQSTHPMPELPDPVVAYRRYYATRKWSLARWTRGRDAPDWWREECEEAGTWEDWVRMVHGSWRKT